MNYFENYSATLLSRLRSVAATNRNREYLGVDEAIRQWSRMTVSVQQRGGSHFLIGNGASATMASHLALDAAKNAGLRALAFNDAASLTALGNDIGFEQCFAAPLRWHGRRGDLLIAISSSGSSPNIVAGITTAAEAGLGIVTLTGLQDDNPARRMGDLNFYVPAKTYGMVECIHQILLHCWLDGLLGLREWDGAKPTDLPGDDGGPLKS